MNRKRKTNKTNAWRSVFGNGVIPLSEATTFLLQAAARKLRSDLAAELHRHGITVTQWFALRALNERASLTVNELTELSHRSQPAMSRAVDSLHKKGLVTKRSSKKDKRTIELRLTRKGSTLFTKDFLPGARKTFRDKVTPREYAELRRILKKLLA